MQTELDRPHREMIRLSLSLGVTLTLVCWCFEPVVGAARLSEARFEAALLTGLAAIHTWRSLQALLDVVRLGELRRRDRDYWSHD